MAAILQLPDGRYILQHRDDIPSIWYPGHWGCFGGAVDGDEDPIQALHREVNEELELQFETAEYFTRFDFDLGRLRMGTYYRNYYVIQITDEELSRCVLHEGQAMRAVAGDEALETLRMTPYDAFALFLYHRRSQLGPAR